MRYNEIKLKGVCRIFDFTMVITWYGEGCFKTQEGDTTILTDPFEAGLGLTPPRLKARIVLKTLTAFPLKKPENEGEYLISGPGEYNIKGIDIAGFLLAKESTDKFLKTIYLVKTEGVNLCFLGHLSNAPEPNILERLEEIDILFIPAGGSPYLDPKAAVKITNHLEPKIVVPRFFKIPGLKRQAADIKLFLREFNHEKVEAEDKLSIRKKDLALIKGTRVILLKI